MPQKGKSCCCCLFIPAGLNSGFVVPGAEELKWSGSDAQFRHKQNPDTHHQANLLTLLLFLSMDSRAHWHHGLVEQFAQHFLLVLTLAHPLYPDKPIPEYPDNPDKPLMPDMPLYPLVPCVPALPVAPLKPLTPLQPEAPIEPENPLVPITPL